MTLGLLADLHYDGGGAAMNRLYEAVNTLRLGRVNTLNVNAINSGYSGRTNTNLLFDPGLTSPSVTIRG